MPFGGKIPDLDHMFPVEEERQWSKELAISTQHYTSECNAYTLTLYHAVHMTCYEMISWTFHTEWNNVEIRAYLNVFAQENAAVRRNDWGVCQTYARPNMIMVRNCSFKKGTWWYLFKNSFSAFANIGLSCLCGQWQWSRPVCYLPMTKAAMQRCRLKFARSFDQARWHCTWGITKSILYLGPAVVAPALY